MAEVEGCEQRHHSSGEPCCNRLATHVHALPDSDGEVLYLCDKHSKNCKGCLPLEKESTDT